MGMCTCVLGCMGACVEGGYLCITESYIVTVTIWSDWIEMTQPGQSAGEEDNYSIMITALDYFPILIFDSTATLHSNLVVWYLE